MDRHHFQVNHLFSSAANSFFGSRRNSATVGVGSSDVPDSNTMLNAFNKREQQHPTGVPRSVDPLPFPAATNDYGNYYSSGEVMASRQDGDAETGSNAMAGNSKDAESIKAKIIAHPQYPNMLEAYMDCQKIGAPPEVVDRLSAVSSEWERTHRSSAKDQNISASDPELDQFMEAYYDMLVKYREELSRPLQEAMQFVRSVESQLNSLRDGPARGAFSIASDCIAEDGEDKDEGGSGDDAELQEADPQAEETELKQRLLKKYSGYLGSLKQELSKKKKKAKLPKEARQKLLNWWELHYKWPYPSESEKASLAESTGLDQKQINNWFINQRKRHWKPSDDMQFVVMDGHHPHHMNTAFFIDNHMMGDTSFRFGP